MTINSRQCSSFCLLDRYVCLPSHVEFCFEKEGEDKDSGSIWLLLADIRLLGARGTQLRWPHHRQLLLRLASLITRAMRYHHQSSPPPTSIIASKSDQMLQKIAPSLTVLERKGGTCQQPKRNCYLHRVGVPETVLVAVVELLHVAEGLEGHVKNRERGRPPPHLLLPQQPLVSLPASSFSSKVLVPASEAGHHLAVAHLGTHLTISHPLSPPRHPVTAPPVLSWTTLEKDFSDWAPQLCPKLNLPMPPICRARDALILFTSHPRTTWEPTIFNQRWQRSFQTVFPSLSLGATRDSLLWGRQRKSWCHHSSRAIVSW